MKTYLKVFILVAVLLFGTVLNVFAAEDSVSLTASSAKVKEGDTFSVAVNVKSTTNFEGLSGVLNYNKEKLELLGVTNGTGMSDMNSEDASGNYVITVFSNSSTPVTQAVCQTLNFKVLSGVTEGEDLNISISEIQFSEEDKEPSENLSASTSVQVEVTQVEPEPQEPENPTPQNPTEEDNKPSTPTDTNKPSTPADTDKPSTPADTNKPSTSADTNKSNTQADQNKETDKTIKSGTIPKAGNGYILNISIAVVSIMTVVFYVISRKYKNI